MRSGIFGGVFLALIEGVAHLMQKMMEQSQHQQMLAIHAMQQVFLFPLLFLPSPPLPAFLLPRFSFFLLLCISYLFLQQAQMQQQQQHEQKELLKDTSKTY